MEDEGHVEEESKAVEPDCNHLRPSVIVKELLEDNAVQCIPEVNVADYCNPYAHSGYKKVGPQVIGSELAGLLHHTPDRKDKGYALH